MSSSRSREIRAALRDLLPVLLAIAPFGLLSGALSVNAGLTPLEAVAMSATIYAGASQLAALEMNGLGAPLWSVLLTIFALNFRHVLYSASIGRHLGHFSGSQKAGAFFLLVDPIFGAGEAQAEKGALTKTWYFAYGIALYVSWCLTTLIGALFGALVTNPKALGLDFVLPVYFLTLLMTFRHRGGFYPVALASLASSVLVYLLLGPPWHVTIGALGGIAYAAFTAQGETAPEGERAHGDRPAPGDGLA